MAPHIKPVWRIWRATRPYALEHGSDDLPLRFKLWFGKAFDLARDIASFAASTIASKSAMLEKQLAAPSCRSGQNATSPPSCRPKSGRAQDQR